MFDARWRRCHLGLGFRITGTKHIQNTEETFCLTERSTDFEELKVLLCVISSPKKMRQASVTTTVNAAWQPEVRAMYLDDYADGPDTDCFAHMQTWFRVVYDV